MSQTSKQQRRASTAPRAWQRMLSGRRLDLLDPSPLDIEIEDIAHGLARVARWNGQTQGDHAFSVAQHSLLVTEITSALQPEWSADWKLAALLHDSAEYVVGDLISPFKAAIGDDYKQVENDLIRAIHIRFGLPATLPGHVSAIIKQADRISAYFEATCLAGFAATEAREFFGTPATLPYEMHSQLEQLRAIDTATAQANFLGLFASLQTIRTN
ncbi:MAG: HD family hydrolase [Pseudomonadota bacterium]